MNRFTQSEPDNPNISREEWVAPQEELRKVVVRYLLTYGDSPSRTLTQMRRDLKVILAAYDE